MVVRLEKRHKVLLLVVWTLLVLYPNPSLLIVTIGRSLNPPIDPVAVRPVSAQLPDDPAQAERLILTKYLPYAYDWTVFGVPWYFPTPAEALDAGRGDCEARAVVLASVLEDKHIPYEFSVSPIHIWVKYDGKAENTVENEAVAFVEHKDGSYRLKVPTEFDFERYLNTEIDSLWEAMPVGRKALLVVGAAVILVMDFLLSVIVPRLPRRRSVSTATEKS